MRTPAHVSLHQFAIWGIVSMMISGLLTAAALTLAQDGGECHGIPCGGSGNSSMHGGNTSSMPPLMSAYSSQDGWNQQSSSQASDFDKVISDLHVSVKRWADGKESRLQYVVSIEDIQNEWNMHKHTTEGWKRFDPFRMMVIERFNMPPPPFTNMDEYLENLFIDIKKMWEAFKPTLYDIPTSGTPINPLPWDTKPREETTKPTEVKGCYDIKGYWTYDRAACVSDQSPFYLKNLPDERVAPSSTHTEDIPSFAPMQMPTLDREEEEIQKRIEEKFIEPIVRTEKAQSLLSTIRDIVRRLDILSEYRQFSISVEQRMTVTREWLASIAADYSLREPSLDEMQRRADEIRLAMEDLETAMREGGTTVQASPEYAKTKASEMLQQISKILSQVPAAFDILTANDIAVPSEAIERYKAARSLYGKLEPECTYDLGKCPTLANVLDALDGMRTPLQDAVRAADDPGIAHDIEALFQ